MHDEGARSGLISLGNTQAAKARLNGATHEQSHDTVWPCRIGSCGILCPTERGGEAIAKGLSERGLQATYMPGRDVDLRKPGIKVLTLKSSKGLEFPIVALAGFLDAPYPMLRQGLNDEEREELLGKERRTLYVAMTRAMRALLVIAPASAPSPLLQGFDGQHWNLE